MEESGLTLWLLVTAAALALCPLLIFYPPRAQHMQCLTVCTGYNTPSCSEPMFTLLQNPVSINPVRTLIQLQEIQFRVLLYVLTATEVLASLFATFTKKIECKEMSVS